MTSADVVIPTLGRGSLALLLASLDGPPERLPHRVILVDDRATPAGPLDTSELSPELRARLDVVAAGGHGPAAARNCGWHASDAEWVAFLDDDVIPCRGWMTELCADLDGLPADVGGSQGRLLVPMPSDRAPTDRERGVHGLETARWATANIAYRTRVLARVGGFDERFPHAYREDADLAVRVCRAGFRIVDGRRPVVHPVWPASPWVSVRAQAGNADDALMRRLHGDGWRAAAQTPSGRFRRHAIVTALGAAAVVAAAAGHRLLAAAAGGAWLVGTAEFAWARIAGGPRTPREVATMTATSIGIPPTAVWHRLRGELRARRLARTRDPERRTARIDAVLFDRDGTIVRDVPRNRDPAAVEPVAGAREAVRRLRAAGIRVAVVTNQAVIGEGVLTPEEVQAVNARIDALVGPFDAWLVCPHARDEGCTCRKPAPGLVRRALRELDVAAERCAFVGDTGADVEAARAAGVRPILVPNGVTRRDEIAAAPEVARDLVEATDRLLGARP